NHDISNNSFIINERAQLGRALFYDKSLSLNGKVSCGSCHIQELGFSDGKALSDGFLNQKTPLHSMSLVNIASNKRLFWDGRENNLFKQAILPISNHIEMGLDNESLLIAKIQGNPMYFELFKDAFGDEEINTQRTSVALANFIASLASFNTKFDMVIKDQSSFNELEETGLKLFNEKYNCNSCHGGVNFNSNWGGTELLNIGLDKEDERLFKVPSLRNVMVSAPYMHDGRFNSIDEVLNHYSNGIKDNPKIDWRLSSFTKTNGGMKITTEDRKAIIAFLNTLTDYKLISDPKFSDPF
ncbi:MAG: cytochrome c peroxidase, partial [Candidatus Paceibacterota bacterium]